MKAITELTTFRSTFKSVFVSFCDLSSAKQTAYKLLLTSIKQMSSGYVIGMVAYSSNPLN